MIGAQVCGFTLHWNKRHGRVAADATGSRTFLSNSWRQHFYVRWFDDVRVVMSVDDEGQQSEQHDWERNRHDNVNNMGREFGSRTR